MSSHISFQFRSINCSGWGLAATANGRSSCYDCSLLRTDHTPNRRIVTKWDASRSPGKSGAQREVGGLGPRSRGGEHPSMLSNHGGTIFNDPAETSATVLPSF